MSIYHYPANYAAALLILLISVSGAVIADTEKQLKEGKLQPCPDKPNCISSEDGDVSAIAIGSMSPEQAWLIVRKTIIDLGGYIQKQNDQYLWSTFQTPIMKFTDDLEVRIDRSNGQIHLRSASRTGYYDFNTNRKRVKAIIDRVKVQLQPEKMRNRVSEPVDQNSSSQQNY